MARSVRKRQLRELEPYLLGERPREDGEWDMYCPLHDDSKRSAQLNVQEGVWYCHANCGGGTVAELLDQKDRWYPPPSGRNGSGSRKRSKSQGERPAETITKGKVIGWREALQSSPEALEAIMEARGLTKRTIRRFDIGWDQGALGGRGAYTIPIYDFGGGFWNVRRYSLDPPGDMRKIWSVKGLGAPRLYPVNVFERDPARIIFCEGEWDALRTIQEGYPAITRTTAATASWNTEWSRMFRGRTIYLTHDRDDAGMTGNRKVGRGLLNVAEEVRILELPYAVQEKHGKDLTDFWEEYGEEEFEKLLEAAPLFDETRIVPADDIDPEPGSVLQAFDADRVGRPQRLTLTIKGRREPGYSVPKNVHYTCTRDAGMKCAACPMNATPGEDDKAVDPSDPLVLELMGATKPQIHDILRRHYGAVKCNKLRIDVANYQGVEELYARPSVEHSSSNGAEAYKNMKVTSVGRHDTMANNTVEVVGALHPEPRAQTNEFLAWEVNRLETSLDRFDLDESSIKLMGRFRPRSGQRPRAKLAEIARELAGHVTHIYGRPEMHAAMDLTYHSALQFEFAGRLIQRGWVELLVLGDTRTGKSEAATKLSRFYSAGELVNCESASLAGVVGGLQQYGSSKEWAINWGAIPINDRRLVILDEIGGLSTEDISKMSDIRTSGVAKLTKIQQEATYARTRLIWLSNPRNARMTDYTYGVQAIRPLIGNNEDIARFDLAMTVMSADVSTDQIHQETKTGRQRYTAEACKTLIRWVWSRQPDQVRFSKRAEAAVFREAARLGNAYVEDPPLIQGADAHVKVARLAVAIAARTFSTDKTCEKILVRPEHVIDAAWFMEKLYNMPSFGYAERSRELLSDIEEATLNKSQVYGYLKSRSGLGKFLRSAGRFKRQDLEDVMNISREEAAAIINKLWEARMVRKEEGYVHVEPTLHELLREGDV